MQRPPTPSVSVARFESCVFGSEDWAGIEEYVFLWFKVFTVKQQRLHWVTELFFFLIIFLGHLAEQGHMNIVNFYLYVLFLFYFFFFLF